jgi:hypothetical protein
LDGPEIASMEDLQFVILRKFPSLENLIEVGSSRNDFIIVNGDIHDVGCSSIKVNFSMPLPTSYFTRLQSLSLTGGYLVQDQTIVSLVSLCPPIRSLRVCGLDCRFTMRGFILIILGGLKIRFGISVRKSRRRVGITSPRNSTKRTTLG